MLLIQIIGIMA